MKVDLSPNTSLHGKTVLVLGGRGFIGSHLTDALLAQGAKVRILDRISVQPVSGAPEERVGLQIQEGDFTSVADLDLALDGVDSCDHLVSTTVPQSSNLDPVYDAQTNLLGSLRFIDAAVRHGVQRVVFVSSGGTVYGQPLSVPIREDHPTDPLCAYGITKLAIEKHLELARRLHWLEHVILRLANPYGPRQRPEASQGAIAVFAAKALRGKAIDVWGDGSVVRDFVHITDVVSALIAAITRSDLNHRLFNIGSGHGASINELLDLIRSILSRELSVNYFPARGFDVPKNVLDVTRAGDELGWKPVMSLSDGIRGYLDWLRQISVAHPAQPT